MGQKGQNENRDKHTLLVFPLCDLLLCVSPLENSLIRSTHTLQSIDSQPHFALSLLLVLALPL